jgi:hypothetical protein
VKKRAELGNREVCGCGSGRAYGKCCKKKRVQYNRDGKGRIFKSIVLDKNGLDAIAEAEAAFKETFGRRPVKRDRLLLAAYRYSSKDMTRMFSEIADKAGTPRHLVYAYIKTDGLMLSKENEELASPQDIEDVQAAVDEYLSAAELGIDLLDPEDTPVTRALDEFAECLEDAVIHLGNFADKAPLAVRRDLPLFFQFLLISRCHQALKLVADKWPKNIGTDAIASIRTIYECALIINRLEIHPSYSDTLFAQALLGSELYEFKTKKNGDPDFSVIIERDSGKKFEARTSFLGCAKQLGPRQVDFFNVAYNVLSSHVHFNSLRMLQEYRDSGSFLIWEESDKRYLAIITLVILSYLLITIHTLEQATSVIKSDSLRFFKRVYHSLLRMIDALEAEEYEIDDTTKLLIIRAMELLTDRDFFEDEHG